MKIYHTETQADYDALMVELEEQGAKWPTGTNPTEANNWSEFKRQTGVKVQDCILTYRDVEYFERVNPETPIIKYTAKKETQLPEWANWLARDEDGDLYAFENKPIKSFGDGEWFEFECGRLKEVDETDVAFEDIKWTDERPFRVKAPIKEFSDKAESLRELGEVLTRNWEAEHGKPSVAEYNQWQITQAKAHGYDEVPVVVDKTERNHADKDEDETTIMSFEDTMALLENDMINQPLHYVGNQGLEVEEVLQNFIPRYKDPYVGHRIASAIEYLLRSPLKNQRQDIEKAGKNIQQALAYLDMMEEEE